MDEPVGTGTGATSGDSDTDGTAIVSDTSVPPLEIEELTQRYIDGLKLGLQLDVVLSRDGAVVVRCTSSEVPEDEHVLRSPAAVRHELDLVGLLAEVSYVCEFTATAGDSQAVDRLDLTMPALNFIYPSVRVTRAPEYAGTDYTIFHHWNPGLGHVRAFILDPEGRLRWYWDDGDDGGGDRQFTSLGDGLLFRGGAHQVPTIFDAAYRVIWSAGPDVDPMDFHHDAAIDAQRNVLTLARAHNTQGDRSWEGFRVDAVDPTGATMWSWNSQLAVDAGVLPPGEGDAYHANAVSWAHDAHGDGFFVSLPLLARILRVDPAGPVIWQLGVGLDFTLVDPNGDPLNDPRLWFYFQHDPEFVGSLVTIHDNGWGRPSETQYSRAIRLRLDEARRLATLEWTYREPDWFSPIMGSVQTLPDGHVLIASDHGMVPGQFFAAIREVDPADDSVVHRFDFTHPEDSLYRAERVPGCDLFANRAYCPGL